MQNIDLNSTRKFIIIASTEGETALGVGLDEILASNTSADSEMMYVLWEHTDAILDLGLFDSLKFQPNRDDKTSKGVIVRVR